jgi:hypothetical protein
MLDALGDHPKRERRDRARTEAMAPLQLGSGLGDPLWITQIRRRGALASRSLGSASGQSDQTGSDPSWR